MGKDLIPLTFGQGLDREAGVLSGGPGRLEEARNVILRDGRFEPRKGMELRSSIPGASYVAMLHALRASHQAVAVTGEGLPGQVGHNVRVWLGSGRATGFVSLGLWQTPTASLEKVKAIAGESGSRLFIAHEEQSLLRRASTVYVDSQDAAPLLHTLTAEWARGGNPANSDAIKFRGVVPWQEYLVGWGFWTNAEHKPEALRISSPGEPSLFEDYAWKLPGQAGDPVVACASSGSSLMIYKETELHVLTGSYGGDFDLSQIEERFGCAAPRLSVSVGDTVYAWSLEGPRRTRGGPSEDLSWPLGLRWPTPDDIRAQGLLHSGFAAYEPTTQVVLFVFGNLFYVWDLRREEWHHWYGQYPVHSGGVLYDVGGYQGASRGYPDLVGTVVHGDGVVVSWADVSPEGDEVVELYRQEPGGGAWSASPVATALVGGAGQVSLSGLAVGIHGIALRYRRQGLYSAAYQGADPSEWPAVSRGTFEVQEQLNPADAPEVAGTVWSRTGVGAEQVLVTVSLENPVAETEVWRGATANALDAALLTTLAPGDDSFVDLTIDGEVGYYYFARHMDGGVPSAFSLGRRAWSGPAATPNLTAVSSESSNFYDFMYGGGVGVVEHYDNHASSDPTTYAQVDTLPAPAGEGFGQGSPYRNAVALKLRNRVTTFGVDDYSEFSQSWTVEICTNCGI